MDLLQLEQGSNSLKEKLAGGFSNQSKLIFISDFFEKVFSTKNQNIIESYLSEFLQIYVSGLKNFDAFGISPVITEKLIQEAERIEISGLAKSFDLLPEIVQRLKNDLGAKKQILQGNENRLTGTKAYFPLLEEKAIEETGMIIGVLESVTIKIHKAKTETKFIIIPSEKEIEEKINEQVKESWQNAIIIAKKYRRKILPHHEVIISFDKKAGFCKGNSLGTALTLSFIEELLKVYNPPVVIKIGEGIAFTGGMNVQRKITNTSEDIIKQKTEIVFYSDIKLFVVPKEEEESAKEKVNELKEKYPDRRLEIIGAEKLNDILNRRDLVEIKKINPVVRTAKFAKTNWVAMIMMMVIVAMIYFAGWWDLDTNPHSFTADGNKIYIKNENGELLWEKYTAISTMTVDNFKNRNIFARLIDINNDGENEVIICGEQKNISSFVDHSTVTCYNYKGETVWQYSFNDKVSSKLGELNSDYSTILLDTLTFNGEKSLFLISTNLNSFSSAISRINLENGKRLIGTFWASGHVISAIIKDIDNDNKPEILGIGYDNGYEDVVFFAYEIDTLTKVRPTTENYLISNFAVSEMKAYIRFPKTDYDNYYAVRTPLIYVEAGDFSDDKKGEKYLFVVANVRNHSDAALSYEISYNLKVIDVIVDSDFRVQRDTLVAHDFLKPPFTDTKEYVEIIKSKILYWKNGKWVKREELE